MAWCVWTRTNDQTWTLTWRCPKQTSNYSWILVHTVTSGKKKKTGLETVHTETWMDEVRQTYTQHSTKLLEGQYQLLLTTKPSHKIRSQHTSKHDYDKLRNWYLTTHFDYGWNDILVFNTCWWNLQFPNENFVVNTCCRLAYERTAPHNHHYRRSPHYCLYRAHADDSVFSSSIHPLARHVTRVFLQPIAGQSLHIRRKAHMGNYWPCTKTPK